MLWYGSCCILKHVCAGEVYHCRMLFGGSLSWVEKWWCLTKTHRQKRMNKYILYYIHWCHHYAILYPLVPPVEYCGWRCFPGVQYELVMCRQQDRDGQVSSTCNSSHVWENFSFFGPSLGLRYGIKTSSAVWRQVRWICYGLNLLRLIRLFGRFLTPMLHRNEGLS